MILHQLKQYIKKAAGTKYEWQSHIDNIVYIFDKNLKTYNPSNILDVGSGDGSRTFIMANYFNIRPDNIYGIDYEDKYIVETSKFFNARKIDLETGLLPYEDETFDLVTCNQVLEHLKNYGKVIDEVIRVSKKGGYIVFGIPNLAHLINRIYLLLGFQPLCIVLNGPHVRGYTHSSFIKLLNSINRLKLVDCTGSLMYPLPLVVAKCLTKYFVGLSGYTCYLLQKIR
jgi:ubiquinone/menaquinone biosynthesis C-methylase UbiE